MASNYSYGSQRSQPVRTRSPMPGPFNQGAIEEAHTLPLTSTITPKEVDAFLAAQGEKTFVRVASGRPPYIYSTNEHCAFKNRSKLQRYLLAYVIGPAERMRGNEEAITLMKVAIQPVIPNMTTERLRNALTALCQAEQLRLSDQSSFMTAWEKNQTLFEEYIRIHDYYVVRIVLSWLGAGYDHASETDRHTLLDQAIRQSRLVHTEKAILTSVAEDLRNIKTWMSKASWQDDLQPKQLLDLLEAIASMASLPAPAHLPALPALPMPKSLMDPVIAEHAGETGSAPEKPRKETATAKNLERDVEFDAIIDKISNAKPYSQKPVSNEIPATEIRMPETDHSGMTVTTVTATQPELYRKKSSEHRRLPSSSGNAGLRKSAGEARDGIATAASAPGGMVSQPSFLTAPLENRASGRSGKPKRKEEADSKNKRKSMPPQPTAHETALPHRRAQRNSVNLTQFITPPVSPQPAVASQIPRPVTLQNASPSKQANQNSAAVEEESVTFEEFLKEGNNEQKEEKTRRRLIRPKKLRLEKFSDDKPAKRQDKAVTPVKTGVSFWQPDIPPSQAWQSCCVELASLQLAPALILSIGKILDRVEVPDHEQDLKEALKVAGNKAELSQEEARQLRKFFADKKNLTKIEDVLLKQPAGGYLLKYLQALSQQKF